MTSRSSASESSVNSRAAVIESLARQLHAECAILGHSSTAYADLDAEVVDAYRTAARNFAAPSDAVLTPWLVSQRETVRTLLERVRINEQVLTRPTDTSSLAQTMSARR